jgi:hypothetical protein
MYLGFRKMSNILKEHKLITNALKRNNYIIKSF